MQSDSDIHWRLGSLVFSLLTALTILWPNNLAQAKSSVALETRELFAGSLTWLYEDMPVRGPALVDPSQCPGLGDRFVLTLPSKNKTCFSFSYGPMVFKLHALLLKADEIKGHSRSKLIIYNHGHGGLPNDHEQYARRFLSEALEEGIDILLVSMPFTGINQLRAATMVRTWDGWARLDPKLFENSPAAVHGVFETLDTGQSLTYACSLIPRF